MRDFFRALLKTLLRDLVLVGLGTLLLGLAGWTLLGFTPIEAFAGALTACITLWLFLRFYLNS